jgi:hypothetical protein
MNRSMVLAVALIAVGCGSSSQRAEPPRPDPTKDAWYRNAVDELGRLSREAEALHKTKPDAASALILQAQGIVSQVLGVPRPSLEAMQFSSDIDDLYGRMLMSNRHYGSARLMFQKNVARWTHWRPQTEETERRRKAAEAAIAECDRLIERQSR